MLIGLEWKILDCDLGSDGERVKNRHRRHFGTEFDGSVLSAHVLPELYR